MIRRDIRLNQDNTALGDAIVSGPIGSQPRRGHYLMTSARSSRGRRRAIGLLATLMTGTALAQVGPVTSQSLFYDSASNAHQGDYLALGAGLAYTDNATLQPSGGPSATIGLLGLMGDVTHQGPVLDLHLASDIAVLKYFNSTYPTQPTGYLDGGAELKIVPGIFSWTLRETYSQAVLNPTLPVTPDNLEGLNYITTGPRLTLQPNERTTIVLDGSYSYVDSSSKSPLYVNISNQRYGGDLTLSYAPWTSTRVYLTGSSEEIRFTDQTENTDYRSDQGLAGLKVTGARTVLDLAAGYTGIHANPPAGTAVSGTGAADLGSGGVTWRAELSRLLSPRQRISLHARQQVTEAADLLRLDFNQAVPTTALYGVVTSKPVTDREFGANWRLDLNRTSVVVDLVSATAHYAASNLDSQLKSASVLFARKLSPLLSWDIGATFQHADYELTAPQDTVYELTNLRWAAGQRLEVRLTYAHVHSTLAPGGYSDNQVLLMASYALVSRKPGEEPPSTPLRPMSPLSAQPNRP